MNYYLFEKVCDDKITVMIETRIINVICSLWKYKVDVRISEFERFVTDEITVWT